MRPARAGTRKILRKHPSAMRYSANGEWTAPHEENETIPPDAESFMGRWRETDEDEEEPMEHDSPYADFREAWDGHLFHEEELEEDISLDGKRRKRHGAGPESQRGGPLRAFAKRVGKSVQEALETASAWLQDIQWSIRFTTTKARLTLLIYFACRRSFMPRWPYFVFALLRLVGLAPAFGIAYILDAHLATFNAAGIVRPLILFVFLPLVVSASGAYIAHRRAMRVIELMHARASDYYMRLADKAVHPASRRKYASQARFSLADCAQVLYWQGCLVPQAVAALAAGLAALIAVACIYIYAGLVQLILACVCLSLAFALKGQILQQFRQVEEQKTRDRFLAAEILRLPRIFHAEWMRLQHFECLASLRPLFGLETQKFLLRLGRILSPIFLGIAFAQCALAVANGALSLGGLVACILLLPCVYQGLASGAELILSCAQARQSDITSLLGLWTNRTEEPQQEGEPDLPDAEKGWYGATPSGETGASSHVRRKSSYLDRLKNGRRPFEETLAIDGPLFPRTRRVATGTFAAKHAESWRTPEDAPFMVSRGCWVGLEGSDDAGLSRIVNIILGMADEHDPPLSLDGYCFPSSEVPSWYQNRIAYVPQEPFFPEGKIVSMLRKCRDANAPTRQEAEEVLRGCGIWETVKALPQGLHTVIRSDTPLLSLGEKQRLAIAITLLADPPLLVLDDATSNLDDASEARICRFLRERVDANQLTIVSLSHRHSFHQNADCVYRLDGKARR